jgi:hypothetical protein
MIAAMNIVKEAARPRGVKLEKERMLDGMYMMSCERKNEISTTRAEKGSRSTDSNDARPQERALRAATNRLNGRRTWKRRRRRQLNELEGKNRRKGRNEPATQWRPMMNQLLRARPGGDKVSRRREEGEEKRTDR